MSKTRRILSAKGLIMLVLMATPLLTMLVPDSFWQGSSQANTINSHQSPNAANIPSNGFGLFWVNGSQYQENNTLYFHVNDTLNIQIQVGSGITGTVALIISNATNPNVLTSPLTVASGSLSGTVTLWNDGPASQKIVAPGFYTAYIAAGCGFYFNINVTHAPPLINNITLWDNVYKTNPQTIPVNGIYENYRYTSLYANISVAVRSYSLGLTLPPTVIMNYNDSSFEGFSRTMSGFIVTPGTFNFTYGPILTTPDTSGRWPAGDYPVSFTVDYGAGIPTGRAVMTLRILDLPPNITSMAVSPNVIPAVSGGNLTVTVNASDPDDGILYGSAAQNMTAWRTVDGSLINGSGVTAIVGPSDKLSALQFSNDAQYVNFTFAMSGSTAQNYVIFPVSLPTTNATNALNATVGFRLMNNFTAPGSSDTAKVEIFDNSSQTWKFLFDFTQWNPNSWNYTQVPIPQPYMNYMSLNQTQTLYLKMTAFNGTSDAVVSIDMVNVTYNCTRPPAITGVLVTLYAPYTRSSFSQNATYTYDITEWYDSKGNQWWYNLSMPGNMTQGAYSIRVDVFDHGTSTYVPLSVPADRTASSDYQTLYSAADAVLSKTFVVGAASNSSIVGNPLWGASSTGMQVNRGTPLSLAVNIWDPAFGGAQTETQATFPFNSNVTQMGMSSGSNWSAGQNPAGTTITTINGTVNNTNLADGICYNVSIGATTTSHAYGWNNLHFNFTLNQYYFVDSGEISALRLDFNMWLLQGNLSFGIGAQPAQLQVWNIPLGNWSTIATVPWGSGFNDFSGHSYSITSTVANGIGSWIDPVTRVVTYRVQWNETNPDTFGDQNQFTGLNASIDYARLTVTYAHAKKLIVMLTNDLRLTNELPQFYWFNFSLSSSGFFNVGSSITNWAVTIPTTGLPAGTYDVVLRTQTVACGVNYLFAGRFTNEAPFYNLSAAFIGTSFLNWTCLINPAGLSVAINSWVNKTVFRAVSNAFQVQGTYLVTYGSFSNTSFQVQILTPSGDLFPLSPGGTSVDDPLNFGTGQGSFNVNIAPGTWSINITFSPGASEATLGILYFRCWVQGDGYPSATTDVAVTGWQEIYLTNPPPYLSLDAAQVAQSSFTFFRETDYTQQAWINVTEYNSNLKTNLPSGAQVLLGAVNRSAGFAPFNTTMWYGTSSNPPVGNSYEILGTVHVSRDVSNDTHYDPYSNYSLVVSDGDLVEPQTSLLRLNATFYICANPPVISTIGYSTNSPYRFTNLSATIQFSDKDNPYWTLNVSTFHVASVVGNTVIDITNGTFPNGNFAQTYIGPGSIYAASINWTTTFNFSRNATLGSYTVSVTITDPENWTGSLSGATLNVQDNIPQIFSLQARKNSDPFQDISLFSYVTRAGDKLYLNVTLQDWEDSFLAQDNYQIASVYVVLSHLIPAGVYQPLTIPLTWLTTTSNNTEIWTNPGFALDPANLLFMAGLVTVQVVATDHDGLANNSFYNGGSSLPTLIIKDTQPTFTNSTPVVVPQSITPLSNEPLLWNISVYCQDAEGLWLIKIYYFGTTASGVELSQKVAAFLVTTNVNGRMVAVLQPDSTGAYICSLDVTAYVTQNSITMLNVTSVEIYDWDYENMNPNYQNSFGYFSNPKSFTNLQTTIGEPPGQSPNTSLIIIIAVVALVGVSVIYGIYYYRKHLSIRRYM